MKLKAKIKLVICETSTHNDKCIKDLFIYDTHLHVHCLVRYQSHSQILTKSGCVYTILMVWEPDWDMELYRNQNGL